MEWSNSRTANYNNNLICDWGALPLSIKKHRFFFKPNVLFFQMLPFWIIFYRHTRNPRGVFSHFKPFKKSCFNIFKSSFYSIWTLLVYSILNHLFYNMTACWWSTLLATSFTLCQNPLLLWISNQESYGFPKKNINIYLQMKVFFPS